MKHDIVVAGGGPAGSMAAVLAARQGFDVALIEARRRGTYHPCSGVFPAHGLTGFPGLPDRAFERDMVTMRVMSPRNDALLDAREFGKTLGKIILRSTFDACMLAAAEYAGASILEETMIRDVIVNADGVIAHHRDASGKDATTKGDVLFLATGASGFHLHPKVGLGVPPVVESVIAEYESSPSHVEEVLSSGAYHYYVNKAVSSIGPFWISCRETTFNAGIIDRKTSKERFLDVVASDRRVKHLFQDATLRTWPGMKGSIAAAMIPAAPLSVPYADRVLALGDSAGLAHQFYYEGVWEARLSAKMAVEMACTLRDQGKPPLAANLAPYKSLLARHLVNKWLRSGRRNSYMFWQAHRDEEMWGYFCETMSRSKEFRRLIVECYEADYSASEIDYDFKAGELIFQHMPALKKVIHAPLFLKVSSMK